MLDLHTHILPKMDDGAKDVEASLKMLCDASEQGVEFCVATPHCVVHKNEDIDYFLKRRKERFCILKERFNGDVDIVLGAEVYLDNDISRYDNIKKLCIENTSVMLIELPHQNYDERFAEWIYSLTLLKIHPLIAHIDRYREWERFVYDLRDIDVTFQINASRFLSFSGQRKVQKILSICEKVIVSSDMHNTSVRRCNMKRAFDAVRKKYPSLSKDLFYNTAADMLCYKNSPRF